MSNDTQASPVSGSADTAQALARHHRWRVCRDWHRVRRVLALSNPSIGSREQLSSRLRRRCPRGVYSLVCSGDTAPLATTPSESVVT